jgi:hypothetical protein
METNWNASSRGLQPSVLIVSFSPLQLFSCFWGVKIAHCAYEEASPRCTISYSSPSVLEIAGLRVPARYIRDFALFNVCSSSKFVLLLDAHKLLMLFAGTSTYFEPQMFSLIIFYNGPCIILKHQLYTTCMYVCMYVCIIIGQRHMGWYCKRRVIWKTSGGLYANNREQYVIRRVIW